MRMYPVTENIQALPTTAPSVAYWAFNYAPKWEAASKEVKLLADTFRQRLGTRIISFDQHRNGVDLQEQDSHLSLPLGLLSLPMLMWSTRGVGVNHVFASAGETRLTRLLAARGNAILTIAKDSPWLDRIEQNAPALKALRYIVVESERHRDLMRQLGLPDDKVELIYPGVQCAPYRPAEGPFTILFATSPLQKYGMLSRGVHLMVAVAKQLPEVRFRFIWRKNVGAVRALVREARVRNVEIVSGYVPDMGAQYDAAHAAILPALTETSLKPCPHSGLLALAHGKPVLASRPTSFSDLVTTERCGVVFEPNIPSLCDAIRQLMANYEQHQSRAHDAIRTRFSEVEFVARYEALYAALLSDRI
jgi:glycosyltransferase involved in cell wall biosynthesis